MQPMRSFILKQTQPMVTNDDEFGPEVAGSRNVLSGSELAKSACTIDVD